MKSKNLASIQTQEKKIVKADNKLCSDKAVDDESSQSERFMAKARELGLDEREETFDVALTKVARHKPLEPGKPVDASPSFDEAIKSGKPV